MSPRLAREMAVKPSGTVLFQGLAPAMLLVLFLGMCSGDQGGPISTQTEDQTAR